MKRNINSYGRRKLAHKEGNNPLSFQFIKTALKLTVIIIEEFHFFLTPWRIEPGGSMYNSQVTLIIPTLA